MEDETLQVIVLILSSLGCFCMGLVMQAKRVEMWRIRWIEMEHDLARLQHREPRNISEIDE